MKRNVKLLLNFAAAAGGASRAMHNNTPRLEKMGSGGISVEIWKL